MHICGNLRRVGWVSVLALSGCVWSAHVGTDTTAEHETGHTASEKHAHERRNVAHAPKAGESDEVASRRREAERATRERRVDEETQREIERHERDAAEQQRQIDEQAARERAEADENAAREREAAERAAQEESAKPEHGSAALVSRRHLGKTDQNAKPSSSALQMRDERFQTIAVETDDQKRRIDDEAENKKAAVRDALARNRSKALAAAEREKGRIRAEHHETTGGEGQE